MTGTARPANDAERVAVLRSLDIQGTQDDRFGPVARVAADLFGVPSAFVALLDEEVLRFQACVAFPGEDLPREESFCGHVVVAGRLLVVPDLATDERFTRSPFVTRDGFRFYAGHPLRVRGHIVGTLCILDRVPRDLSAAEEERLADLARWAEAEVRGGAAESATLSALRQREAVLLRATDAAVFGIDGDGYVTFANPAAARLLGDTEDEIVGTDFHARFHHTRADGSPYPWEECPSYRAVRSGERQRARSELLHRADGTLVEVEYSGTPLVVGHEVVGVVVTLADLTEQRAVERMKDEFISVVSHELRTPLTSIRGSLGLLHGGVHGALPEQAARLVAIALGSTERLIRLVNDMLDLERLDAGRVELILVAQPLRAVFDAVQDNVSADGVVVTYTGGDVVASVDGDAMTRALTNLVGNAVKFSPPGTTVRVEATGGVAVTLTVTDAGRGIPPDRLERVFERFEQVDATDSRQKGGTGLGLPIARSIVERHGGTITVESELGAWTRFTIRLPG